MNDKLRQMHTNFKLNPLWHFRQGQKIFSVSIKKLHLPEEKEISENCFCLTCQIIL